MWKCLAPKYTIKFSSQTLVLFTNILNVDIFIHTQHTHSPTTHTAHTLIVEINKLEEYPFENL